MAEAVTMTVPQERRGASDIVESLHWFREVRTGTIRLAAPLTETQAQYRPDRNRWSVAQNLDHILITDAVYRSQIIRLIEMARTGKGLNLNLGLAEGGLKIPFVPQAFLPLLSVPLTMVNLLVPAEVRESILRFPFIKAKNPRMLEPNPSKPIAVLREELAASLSETEALLMGELPSNIGRVTLTHPIFGRNTVANVLGLTTAHEQRHGIQIRNPLRQPGFPAR